MSNKILVVFAVIAFVILLPTGVLKAQASTLTAGPLEISYDGDRIFSEFNITPGSEFEKLITVKNNGSTSHSLAIASKNVVGDLASLIYLRPEVNLNEVWSMSIDQLSHLNEESKTIIDSIGSGEIISFTLKAYLGDAGNEIQNKNVSFDLVFGTQESEPVQAGITTFSAQNQQQGTVAVGTVLSQESPLPESSATATNISSSGDVKGAQSGGGMTGEDWKLLLIVPIIAVLGLAFVANRSLRSFALMPVAGVGTLVASFFVRGNMNYIWFYIALALELAIAILIGFYLKSSKKNQVQ